MICIISLIIAGTSILVLAESSSKPLIIGGSNDFAANYEITSDVFNTFLDISDDGRPIPGPLVSSWEKSDDGLKYTFHLKEGVTFQDGTPWDEKSAKWWFDWSRAGPMKSTLVFKKITGVSVPGKNTVEITLDEPYGNLPKDLTNQGYCQVRSPDSVSPEWSTDGEITSYIGTGPFVVKEYRKGQSALLERKDTATAGNKITLIEWNQIPDANARVSALRAGDVNLIGAAEHHASVPYEQIPMLSSDPKFKIEKKSYGRYQVVEMNCRDGILKDEKVREAINHALDRNTMVKELLSGAVAPATTIVSPTYKFASSLAGSEYTYDPDKAKAILKEDGWSDSNGDGVLEKDGKSLVLNYVVPKGEANAESIAVFLQSELKKVGIQVDVNTVESGGSFQADGKYDLYLHHSYGVPGLPDGPLTGKYHSTWSTWPAAYHDDQLDTLIEKAVNTDSDQDYSNAYKYLQEKNACIPLYDIEKIAVMDSGVSGLILGPSIYAVDLSTVSVA
jgi:peptide/nickel transport system substrate-binding protein